MSGLNTAYHRLRLRLVLLSAAGLNACFNPATNSLPEAALLGLNVYTSPILSFSFTAADNPSLSRTKSGIIERGGVRVGLATTAATLTSLKPTIVLERLTGVGTDCATGIAVLGAWHVNCRTVRLMSGHVLWDLIGNAYEWVRDVYSFNVAAPPYNRPLMEFAYLVNDPALIPLLAPSGTYGAVLNLGNQFRCNCLSATLLRGGRVNAGGSSGVYAATEDANPLNTNNWNGFRCVYHPQP